MVHEIIMFNLESNATCCPAITLTTLLRKKLTCVIKTWKGKIVAVPDENMEWHIIDVMNNTENKVFKHLPSCILQLQSGEILFADILGSLYIYNPCTDSTFCADVKKITH